MTKRIVCTLLGAWALLAALAADARACADCLTGFGEDSTAEAFNWSVLFLMATPYLVVGSIFGWLCYRYRRAAAKGQSLQEREPAVKLTWNPKESER